VAAQRTALNLLVRGGANRTRPLDDALERRLAESADPELLLARAHLRDGLQAAIRHALAGLSARDRTLLRLSVLGGVGCRKLAEMYGVNFATVSRWLARSRASLLAAVESFLRKECGIDPAELTSLLGAARSQIDLSLSGLLTRDD
jgi:RNA polymerase sigma-70 factor, ECF subfamily